MVSFEKRGWISVWVGLTLEDRDKDVLKDLCGVDYYDVDFQENVIAQNGDLVPVLGILERLSFSKSFIKEAIAAAGKLGIAHVRQAIAQLNFKYDPAKVTKPVKADPVFLGAFRWSKE
jgi:hypothetical protein